jgi:preprotein translocase subunit SecD
LEADVKRLPPGEKVRDAVDIALEIIRNRIDQFGVREPTIVREGQNRIVVNLPGIEDPQRAIDLIGKTALLEFKLVDEKGDLSEALEGVIPPGSEILYDSEGKAYLVKKEALLTGGAIKDARVEIGEWGQPYVALDFTKEGAEEFAEITGRHVGERLAIVLDKVVKSAPVIKTRITGGKAVIEGNFSMEEANELRIVLKSGALPVPFRIIQNTTIGPSLGKDSIRKGLISGLIGFIAVLIFMGIYYKKAGLIANLALFLNLLFLLAALAALKATLTLPGIAGIILTIGMSIDANVIIFERIREELKKERAPRSAVDTGYDRALRTILDANITTLIVALILFQFGSGPIKGFATTLSIGILASLFTAVVVTRAIFNLLLEGRPLQKLSI